MSKERARQRKRQQQKQAQKLQAKIKPAVQDTLYESSYRITTKPLPSVLPPEIDEQSDDLYHLAQENPEAAIARLKTLITKYPDIPELYNWLSVAYNGIGDKEAYEKTVALNYAKNPSYLFAKIGYAERCIRNNELDKVLDIFDSKLNLALIYPDRKVFHISEVSGFFSVLALYFLAKGDVNIATQYYDVLVKIAPEEQITHHVGHKLFLHGLDSPQKIRSLLDRFGSIT
jgi:tetratricopeptide (TPR) repeat protein